MPRAYLKETERSFAAALPAAGAGRACGDTERVPAVGELLACYGYLYHTAIVLLRSCGCQFLFGAAKIFFLLMIPLERK